MRLKNISILLLLTTIPLFLSAKTLNVPSEYGTIQSAIDFSTNGDTVLVYPGTYVENINFNGKNIVVGSLFLTTQDTSYISSTIIDGNQNGSVVTFESGEDSTTVLNGFTITNGQSIYGGGINCINNSKPILSTLNVYGNTALLIGGGISCENNSAPYINNVRILYNSAPNSSGGGLALEGNAIVTNCIIARNSANTGGGVYISDSANPIINYSTIVYNSALYAGGVVTGISCDATIANTIIWKNEEHQIRGSNYLNVTYSDIQNGWTGEGNIDSDPLFINSSEDNYHLSNYSPAIGAGADSIEIDGTWYYSPTTDINGNPRPNPAGSKPDMGAYENPLGIQPALIALSSDTLKFKSVGVGNTDTLEFTIYNTSLASELTISDIQSSNSVFTVSQSNFVISADDSAIVAVYFTPDGFINYSDSLTIISGAANEPNAKIYLSAEGKIIISHTPTQNALNIPKNTDISVTFGLDLNPATINDSTFVVHASQTGLRTGTYNYDSGTKTATFNPDNNFVVGEIITIILTTDIENTTGDTLLSSYEWSFTIEADGGSGVFAAKTDYVTGGGPRSVCSADLDGDGDLDLAVARSGCVSVLLNNGNGIFKTKIDYTTEGNPVYVLSFDMQDDGYMDLAVLNDNSYLSTFINNGDGTFLERTDYSVGTTPASVASADFDGDGYIDMIVSNYGTSNISMLLNNGNGTFQVTTNFITVTYPYCIITSDLDKDGDFDLILTRINHSKISIFLNNGDGTFQTNTDYSVGLSPYSVFSSDLDGDGDMDLMTVNYLSHTVSVLLNAGDGSFAPKTDYATGISPYCVTSSDLDADGDMDLITANYSSDDISVLQNEGDGTFATKIDYSVGDEPRSVYTADLDGDGDLDLAVANSNSFTVSVLLNRNTAADIVLTPDSLNFANVRIDSTKSLQFNIYNNGVDTTLQISNITSSNTVFLPGPTTASILPGGSTTITVSFTPTAMTSYTDSLTISSNDLNDPQVKVYVIGEGIDVIPPATPQNLTATPGNQKVTLTWDSNTEPDLHKYNIYRDISSPATKLINSVIGAPPDTFYVDTGLTNGQIYYYRITAVDNAGNESDFSEEVSAIPNPVTIHVSNSGNDSNSGTASNPLRNIQTALSRANSGYTIKVAEGTYEEGLIPQNPVVLLGGYTDNFSESERHRFNHKTIVQAVSATILTDNKGCTVDGFVFDGNSVCDLGIKLTDGSVFTHNLVWRVNAFAAVSMETYGGAVVVNNTIVESGAGLDIYSGSGIPVFKNNIIAHTNFGVNTIGYSFTVRSYNNVYGNTYNYIGFDDTPGIGDISLNPQFVDRDNGDFRLREDSPCIDRGDPDAQYNDPDGSRNDIGVYYYFGEAPSAPTGLTATSGPAAAGQVTLHWNPNTESDLHKYNIYRDISSPATTLINSVVGSPPDTFYVDTGLTSGQIYYYRITAVDNAGNESEYSDEVSATPGIIASIYPVQNELSVAKNTNIQAQFTFDVNPATINENTFVVHAFQTGLHTGTYNYDSGTKTATFDPTSSFQVGDVVTVTLTTGIQTIAGDPLFSPHEWSFTVGVSGGSGKFAAKTDYTAGDGPHSVFSSDLDGDGDMDLAVANEYSNNVSVLLNNGDGTFSAKTEYTAGDSPYSVFSSDLDGDGDMDLAVANGGSGNVSVLLNDGDGTFSAKTDYTAGDYPRPVFSSDLDGDGDMDLAVANVNSDIVSVLLNNGDGTFSAKTEYTAGDCPTSVFSADLDGDGDMDLAVANAYSHTVSVFLNNGDGTFAAKTDYTTGSYSYPHSVFSSDLDGDGDMDLAVANWNSENVSVLLNNGDGTFSAKTDYTAGDRPFSVFSSDLDGDGDMDLAVANHHSKNVSVLLNNGDGTFSAKTDYTAGDHPISVFSSDLDGDGDMDLAVANDSSDNVSVLLNRNREVDISLSSNSLNFGGVKIDSTKSLQFKVYNYGVDSTLEISNITSSNSVFVPSPTTASILPGDSTTITIIFTPIAMTSYSDSLTISSNDPDDPMVYIYVSGLCGNYGLADTPWPKFRGNARNTGQSQYIGPQTNRLVWSFQSGSFSESSPAIGSDGTVYIGSWGNRLYAINPDGTLKWSYQTGSWIRSSPAIGCDGTVYVGSDDGKLYAINSDEILKWSYQTGDSIGSSPAIGGDGTIYVGSGDDKLYAINPDGALKWSYQTGAGIFSSPAIGGDGTVYVGSDDYELYAINSDGTLKWSYRTVNGIISSPAIGSDGTVYVGSDDRLYAINSDGTLKWSYKTGETIYSSYSSPAIGSDGTVYVGSLDPTYTTDNKLYAINSDGTLKWSCQIGGSIYSSPAIGSDGVVYVGSTDYKLYAINPDGALKWSYQTEGGISSSPAIGSDGTLYIGSWDGKLYAFQDLDEEKPSVVLNLPNGDETLYCESEFDIRWEASDNIVVSNIALYYSMDNGTNYIAIDTTEVNDSSYTWTIPNTPSDRCKVKIIARDGVGNTANDISDGTFTIADTTKPNVQLISLNGGERLGIGLTDTIKFAVSDNVGVSYYKIFFSSDNGNSYQLIDSLSSIRNSYIWNVPILFSNECLLKMIAVDSSNNTGEDISDSTFEITDLTDPEVVLVTPTGGEEYVGSLEYTIEWTASDNYKLALAYFYFSSDNGETYSIFDSTNARDFTYDWIAPDIHSDSCKLKIVVKDSIGNSASDSTRAVFKIGRGPTAFLATPATEQSGDVIIEYQLWDKQRDKLSFTSYYSIDSGENWLKANVVGDTSNIDSLHYDGFIAWKSGIDIPHIDKSTIRFKIFVSDTAVGMSGHTGDFHVDNNELPSISALFTPSEEQTGDITIKFCPSDSENDILHYIFKYSVLSDIEWNNATVDFQFDNMQIPADTLSVTWLSQLDIPDQELETVKFCIFPCDNDTGLPSITGAFHIDNETGPIVIGNYPLDFALWQDMIIIDFDRRIDTTSLPGNIEVSGTRSGEISGKNLFSDDIHSLFFIPGNPFMAKETLSVKLGAGISDSLGKGLDGDRDGDPEGSPTDDYTWSFETPYLADYDYSDRIDVADLIIFANAWKSDPQDLSKEIGPVSGTLPDFILTPDHVVDFEDFVILARMWNWSLGLGKISDMFTGGLGKMAAQQPLSEKPLQTVRRKDKYIDESRDLVFNRKSPVRRYADSPVSNPKIPIIYLNPKISDDPWKNSKNGCFEIEVKLGENIDVSGTELVLKYNPELISYNGYAKTQNEALTKANEIISNELFALEEETQSNFDASEDKLIFERKEEGAVLLDIARLSNECIFANSEGNIIKLTFCVVSSGVSDIEYLYSVYNNDAKLLVNERSKVQIDSKLLIPEDYAIYQNYPNPFNSNTIIKYQIPFESKTTINIYDIMGRLVNTLVDERQMPGYYLSKWNGRNNSGQIVSSGMYIYQIISLSEKKDFVKAKKLLLLK